MGNLFRGIAVSQNFREDLATDALHYLLQRTPDPVREKIRNGFSNLWSSIPRLSLNIDRYEVRRRGKASGGIPDLTGYAAPKPPQRLRKTILCAESKFGARLTSAQRTRYLKDLSSGGLLLFIVPDYRRNEFTKLMAIKQSAAGMRWREQNGKVIAVAGWGEVIKALECGIAGLEDQTSDMERIAEELRDLRWFCERQNAMDFYAPLSATDLDRQQTAGFIMSVMNLIDKSMTKATELRVLESSEIYSDDNNRSYGYTIRFGNDSNDEPLEGWCGLYFEAWRQKGQSPIWLQFYAPIADRVQKPLETFGNLNPENEDEWLAPICLQHDVPELTAVQSVVDKIDEIKKALTSSGLLVRRVPRR